MSTAENELLFGFHGGWDTEGYSEAPCPKDYVDILSGELRKDNRKLESEYMKYKKEQNRTNRASNVCHQEIRKMETFLRLEIKPTIA